MANFIVEAKGADLKIQKDGVASRTRISLFDIQININNSILVFFPSGIQIDFNSDTVTGYANAEALGDQIGAWIENANTGS